jgi:hypothetical protein
MAAVCNSCGIGPSGEASSSTALFAALEQQEQVSLANQAAAFELSHRIQQDLVDDITGSDSLHRKSGIIRELKSHLTKLIEKQGVFTAKLAQPLASEGMYVDADHQENFVQLISQLSTAFDWTAAEDCINWGGRQRTDNREFVSLISLYCSMYYRLGPAFLISYICVTLFVIGPFSLYHCRVRTKKRPSMMHKSCWHDLSGI